MNWKRKIAGAAGGGGGGGSSGRQEEMRERLIPAGGEGKAAACVPRGCVAVLVGGEDEDREPERVVVEVRVLGQPCVRALLEMAEREFGYDQKGVLRIPCAAEEFRRAVAADSRTAAGGKAGARQAPARVAPAD